MNDGGPFERGLILGTLEPEIIGPGTGGGTVLERTDWRHDRLSALKGGIVRRGVAAVTGLSMSVFPKRRFQHGALPEPALADRLGGRAHDDRRIFLEQSTVAE